ncbi:MAG: hypothetical protein PHI87_02080 [Candidatus Methanomethylophilus sp.]|nr:hypothetical protein [Methanomethylophilus sp.]
MKSRQLISKYSQKKIERTLLETNSVRKDNIPRMTAVTMLTENKKLFLESFEKETETTEQLLMFWQILNILNIKKTKLIKKAIVDWLYRNLDDKIVIAFETQLAEIISTVKPKLWRWRCSEAVRENITYLSGRTEMLPRQKTLIFLQNRLRNGKYENIDKKIINLYRFSINDVRHCLYELLQKQKISLIEECLKYSEVNEMCYLKGIFYKDIPVSIKSQCIKRFSRNNFYERLAIKRNGWEMQKTKKKGSCKLNIFVDYSQSMIYKEKDINDFLDFLWERNTLNVYTVSEQIEEIDSRIDMKHSGLRTNASLVFPYLESGNPCLFITDGYINLSPLEKRFRKQKTKNKLIIWFVDSTLDKMSKFNSVYYFYGKPEKVFDIIEALLSS